MAGDSGGAGDEGKKKTAAFFTALALSQLPRLAVSAGKLAAVRFQISSSYIPLCLNQMIISYRIAALLGTMVMNGLVLFWSDFKKKLNIVSIVCTSLMGVCYVVMFLAFYTGGEQGHLTLYYWAIVLTSFVYGSTVVSVTTLASSEISSYLAAIPAASITSSTYHLIFLKLGYSFGLQNINYWVVVWQALGAIFLAVLAAIVWSIAYKGDSSDSSSGSSGIDGFSKAISPLMLAAFGYGLQYAFYPAIAPYKLAGIKDGFYISLALLYFGAIPPIVLLVLKEQGMGPERKWNGTGWHCAWFLFAMEVFCAYIFTVILHYPSGRFARAFKSNIMLLSLPIIIYDMCVHSTRGIGSGGASRQGEGGKNPTMATLNTFLYSLTQLIFAFMGNGYLKTYKKAEGDLDNWPTKHYGTLRAFWFWTWNASKCACGNLKTAFTTNVRGSIIEKKEYLFIVYTDG